jgi:hypothetical protein
VLDPTGARHQESLREPPAMREVRTIDRILKGVIQPEGVFYRDDPQNKTGQTLVNITLFGGYPNISNVPLMTQKVNKENGVEWTPDPGDVVLVQFINGNFWEPVVIGFLPLPGNEIQATRAQAPPGKRRYHLRCNKTDVVIDKDGNRSVHVAASELLEVVTDLTVTVLNGLTRLISKGKTLIKSEGTVEIDGIGTGAVKGIVQGDSIDVFTGKPHCHISASVKGSK